MALANPAGKVAELGREVRYLGRVLGAAVRTLPRMRAADFWNQLGTLALSALPLIGIAALFAGMVIALNASLQLTRLGMSHLVAEIGSVSLVRELAPIFTALLMAGKAGAGLASELGMVTLSGQAQAMRAMSVDVDRELIAPRVWACIIGTLLMTIAAMFLGLLGGLILGSAKLGISPVHYLNLSLASLDPSDFACGLIKAVGFGTIIAGLGVTYGLKAKADAGVLGRHTMSAVVLSSFLVLVSDHVFNTFIIAVFG